MADFQQRLFKFLFSPDYIFCIQGLKDYYFDNKRFFVISNLKKFCIDYMIYNKQFPENKTIVINYSYSSLEHDIIIKEWLKQYKKIIIISSYISEYIITHIKKFTYSVDCYIHPSLYPIITSYHDSIDDVHLFLKGFILSSDINKYNKAVIFLKNPYWCDELQKKFVDSFKTISLHGRHLKSQFSPKTFTDISLIFTTNLHHKKNPIQHVRWILDFSDDSKIQMDERKALAGYNMPCNIYYFTIKDSAYIFPSVYPFDWKPIIIHGILANNMTKIEQWSSSSLQVHVKILRDSHILYRDEDDYQFTDIILKQMDFFSKLLVDCPFMIEQYAQITHLYHLSKQSMPEIMIVLTTMCLSIVDILKKYGHHSFFVLPTIKGFSSTSITQIWKTIIGVFSSSSCSNFINILEMLLTVIMTNDKDKYYINDSIWLRFMERWKYLCVSIGFLKLNNNKTSIFQRVIRGILKKYLYPTYWNLDNDEKYISEHFIEKQLLHSRQGIWYPLCTPLDEKLFEYLWKLSDYSDWTSELERYNRRWFTLNRYHPYKRIKLEIDRTLDITVPLPLYVSQYYTTLQQNITQYYNHYSSIFQDKKKNKILFSETIVKEINEEVANRPFMVKYLETMEDFYKWMDKPEEESLMRIKYFEYLENYYEKRNQTEPLITTYSEYIQENKDCLPVL